MWFTVRLTIYLKSDPFMCIVLSHTHTHTHTHTLKVSHIPTNQIMVLKINKRTTGSMKMHLKEVELLKKLHHPNILQ